jgi:hypothetical protein
MPERKRSSFKPPDGRRQVIESREEIPGKKGEEMARKGPVVFVIALFVLISLSCTNPITIYFSTQTAVMETATATMWTPTPTFTPTNTPTDTPTNTPTFTPTPDFIYMDDFEDPDSGWPEYDEDVLLSEYTDGGYRILVREPGWFVWTRPSPMKQYSDIRIQVEVKKIGGPDENSMGVMCRYKDNENFYGFDISSLGMALIYKYEGGEYIGLSADGYEDVDGINPGDVNLLVAVCSGEDLELYVNGDLVASATDSSFAKGQIALLAGNGDVAGADILFDNLYVFDA